MDAAIGILNQIPGDATIKRGQMQETSFVNPLSNGDTSNLNISSTLYQKQNFEEKEELKQN